MNVLKWLIPILLLFLFYGCYIHKKEVKQSEPIVGRVHILLKEGVSPDKLENQFASYAFKKSKKLSFTENRWIFTFDGNLVKGEVLVKELLEKESVVEVKLIENK